jgi:hypothetical protein
MAETMSWTTEQRDALRAAIARGVTRLRMGNEEVQYRSLDEMRRILADMEAELAPIALPRRHYPAVTRGT